VRVGSICRPR